MPNSKAIAGVRIGLIGDRFIVNPTTEEIEDSKLDLLVAGTDSAILMIEVKSPSTLFFLLLNFTDSYLIFILPTDFGGSSIT